MPLKGLLNPANAAPDTGGGSFKEGFVRIDESVFKVKPGREADPAKKQDAILPCVVLRWKVTRLDESMEPMTDEHDAPMTEELDFSLGGKSLASIHPGTAAGVDDVEIEDAGIAPNAEGPTLFMVNENWQIHPKSGMHHLSKSLLGKVEEKYLDRAWAPDWNGCVVFVKNLVTDDKMTGTDGKERPITYKVVDKVVRLPYSSKGGRTAAGGAKGATGGAGTGVKDAKTAEAEVKLGEILEALSAELDGTQITSKRLSMRVSDALKKGDVDPKLHVPVIALLKDQAWLKANSKKYDMTCDFEENSVVFGTLEAK